jgi:hypothetical protein
MHLPRRLEAIAIAHPGTLINDEPALVFARIV